METRPLLFQSRRTRDIYRSYCEETLLIKRKDDYMLIAGIALIVAGLFLVKEALK